MVILCDCVACLLEQMNLSPVTDSLWKRFYQREFGEEHTNMVIKRMKESGGRARYTWRELFKVRRCAFFICLYFWLPWRTCKWPARELELGNKCMKVPILVFSKGYQYDWQQILSKEGKVSKA